MRDRLAAERVAEPAEEPENVDCPLNFAGAFGQRLALLAGEQLRQFRFARLQHLRRLAQNAPARDGRLRGPAREGLLRRINRLPSRPPRRSPGIPPRLAGYRPD